MKYKGYNIEYNPIIEYWSREDKRELSNNPYPNCTGGYMPIGIDADRYMSYDEAKCCIDLYLSKHHEVVDKEQYKYLEQK